MSGEFCGLILQKYQMLNRISVIRLQFSVLLIQKTIQFAPFTGFVLKFYANVFLILHKQGREGITFYDFYCNEISKCEMKIGHFIVQEIIFLRLNKLLQRDPNNEIMKQGNEWSYSTVKWIF